MLRKTKTSKVIGSEELSQLFISKGTKNYSCETIGPKRKRDEVDDLKQQLLKTAAIDFNQKWFDVALQSEHIDVNFKYDKGMTALMHAAKNGNYDFVRELSNHRKGKEIKVNLQDEKGMTALMYAAEKDDILIAQYLTKFKDIDFTIRDFGRTALDYTKDDESRVRSHIKKIIRNEKNKQRARESWESSRS
jgi:hypothetical protein